MSKFKPLDTPKGEWLTSAQLPEWAWRQGKSGTGTAQEALEQAQQHLANFNDPELQEKVEAAVAALADLDDYLQLFNSQ